MLRSKSIMWLFYGRTSVRHGPVRVRAGPPRTLMDLKRVRCLNFQNGLHGRCKRTWIRGELSLKNLLLDYSGLVQRSGTDFIEPVSDPIRVRLNFKVQSGVRQSLYRVRWSPVWKFRQRTCLKSVQVGYGPEWTQTSPWWVRSGPKQTDVWP